MGGTREEIEESKTQQFNQGNHAIALPAGELLEEEWSNEDAAAPAPAPEISSSDDTEQLKDENDGDIEEQGLLDNEEDQDEEAKFQDEADDDLIEATSQQTELKSSLTEEALTFFKLSNELSKNYDKSTDMVYYLLSTRWLRKWKAYVSYDRVIKGKEPNYKHFGVNAESLNEANKDLIDPKATNRDYYEIPVSSNEPHSASFILKPQLLENSHYILVSKEILALFEGKYEDFYSIPRRSFMLENGNKYTEVYYQKVNLIIINHQVLKDIDGGRFREIEAKKVQLFSAETQEELKKFLVPIIQRHQHATQYANFNNTSLVSADKFRLWTLGDLTKQQLYQQLFKSVRSFNSYDYRLKVPLVFIEREKQDITVRNLGLLTDTTLVVEVQKQNGFFFKLEGEPDEAQCEYCRSFKVLQFECKCKKVKYCSENCKEKDLDDHSNTCPFAAEESEDENDDGPIFSEVSVRGRCGLSNLGNTCFMNSALQCLSNTLPLTEYFLSKAYKKEINKTNVLGTQGVLARQYAKFLKNLWVNNSSIFSPVKLKKAVAKVQSMFSGYQQHDSQEFLSYILDGLHEDLNRVKIKKSTETVESQGKTDEEVAEQSWLNHMMRNQSVIVDQMQGQFKSKVTCPDCKRESITFDPFLTCSLPIPHKDLKTITAYLIFANNNRQAIEVSYTYDPNKKLTVQSFKEHCANRYSVPLKSLELFTLSYSNVKASYNSEYELEKYRKDIKYERKSTFLIEQDGDPQEADSTHAIVQFVTAVDSSMYRTYKQNFTFARPLLVKTTDTPKQMHLNLFKYLKPLIIRSNNDIEFNKDAESLGLEELYDKYFLQAVKKPYKLCIETGFNEYRNCPWCGIQKCKNCELSYEGTETIQELASKGHEHEKYLKLECVVETSTKIGKALSTLHSLETNNDEKEDTETLKNPKLEDCLKLFEQAEMLGEDNEWYCSICKKHQQAQKQMQIYRAPDILVLHLKRFKGSGMFKSKLSTVVDFPLSELDMTPFVVQKESPAYYLKNSKLPGFKDVLEEPTVINQATLDSIKAQLMRKQTNNEQFEESSSSSSSFAQGNNQNSQKSHSSAQPKSRLTPQEEEETADDNIETEEKKVDNNQADIEVEAAAAASGAGAAASHAIEEEAHEKPSASSDSRLLYDLYAVTNHYGNLGFGHYTAFAKNGGDWFCYDDSSVRYTSPQSIISEASYILFYARRK